MNTTQQECNHWRSGNSCRTCGADLGPREDRLPTFDDGAPRPKYLGAYRAWLAYGGPEEGGWWVTLKQHIASVLVRADDDLPAVARALWDTYADEDDGRKVSDTSATCAIWVLCEEQPGQFQQLSVGHYE